MNNFNLFNRTMDVMSKSLGLRLARHNICATNLANMDTPGYKVRDLDFESALQQALTPPKGVLLPRLTQVGHMPQSSVKAAYDKAQGSVVSGVYGPDETGEDVLDIDQDMTKLSQNHLLYNATVQILAKEFEQLKYAISEGGR
ncbi:MAG: flagellar basal body rod protein FlgB [Pseudomonadota bacterium]